MARGRLISRSLSASARFNIALPRQASGTFSEFCQLLYLMLIPHTDDFGRLPGDVESVKLECLPASRRPYADFGRALTALHAVGLLTWYEVDGRKFIEIKDFQSHQQGLHKRTKSRFPEIPGNSGKFPVEVEVEVEVEGEGEGEGEGARAREPRTQPSSGKPPRPEKVQFAPYVTMTTEERSKLVEQFGEAATAWMIERLDAYKGSKGKRYACDYRAILSWVVRQWTDEGCPGKAAAADDSEFMRALRARAGGGSR